MTVTEAERAMKASSQSGDYPAGGGMLITAIMPDMNKLAFRWQDECSANRGELLPRVRHYVGTAPK